MEVIFIKGINNGCCLAAFERYWIIKQEMLKDLHSASNIALSSE